MSTTASHRRILHRPRRLRASRVPGHARRVLSMLVLGPVILSLLASRSEARPQLSQRNAELRKRHQEGLRHVARGDALVAAGRRAQAIAEYQSALRLMPSDVTSRSRLGDALVAASRTLEALSVFQNGIPYDGHFGLKAGVTAVKARRTNDASRLFAQTAQTLERRLPPDDSTSRPFLTTLASQGMGLTRRQAAAYALLGFHHHFQADDKTAIPLLRESVRLDARSPQQATTMYRLARALDATEQDAEARSYYDRSRQLARKVGDRVTEKRADLGFQRVYFAKPQNRSASASANTPRP